MLLNLSKIFAPLYGLSFTKEELYAKMADIAEEHKDVLPRNINFGDKVFDALIEFKLLKPHGENNYIFIYDDTEIEFDDGFSVAVEYIILDYSFNLGLNVKILQNNTHISSYIRTDVSLDRTFELFWREKELYAAYCPTPFTLRIMHLPSCADLDFQYIGDDNFRIHSIWIPKDPTMTLPWSHFQGNFGFVSGYYKDDDSCLKLQYLDMIEFSQKRIHREDRFGYIELMSTLSLKNSVDLCCFDPMSDINDRIYIAERKQYRTARNVGKRERSKNLQILRWVCQNKSCHGQGEIVINPAHVDLPTFRCHKCLETVHNVKNNFTFVHMDCM